MKGLPLLTILTLVPLLGALVVIGLAQEQKKLARCNESSDMLETYIRTHEVGNQVHHGF